MHDLKSDAVDEIIWHDLSYRHYHSTSSGGRLRRTLSAVSGFAGSLKASLMIRRLSSASFLNEAFSSSLPVAPISCLVNFHSTSAKSFSSFSSSKSSTAASVWLSSRNRAVSLLCHCACFVLKMNCERI